jgi:hypothetical protein
MVISAKKSQTTVLFHDDEYAFLKRTAEERRVSIGQVIREAVRSFMHADSAIHAIPLPASDERAEQVAV